MRDTGDDGKVLQPTQVTQVISFALKFPNVKHVLDVRYKAEERKVIRVFKHEHLCRRKCVVSDTAGCRTKWLKLSEVLFAHVLQKP